MSGAGSTVSGGFSTICASSSPVIVSRRWAWPCSSLSAILRMACPMSGPDGRPLCLGGVPLPGLGGAAHARVPVPGRSDTFVRHQAGEHHTCDLTSSPERASLRAREWRLLRLPYVSLGGAARSDEPCLTRVGHLCRPAEAGGRLLQSARHPRAIPAHLGDASQVIS